MNTNYSIENTSQPINARDHHEPGIELGKQETQTGLVLVCRFACLPDSHRLAQLCLASDATLARGRSTAARLALKNFPELQALIGRGGREHLSIGAKTAVKDAGLMGGDLNVAHQGWVAPDAKRVIREAT